MTKVICVMSALEMPMNPSVLGILYFAVPPRPVGRFALVYWNKNVLYKHCYNFVCKNLPGSAQVIPLPLPPAFFAQLKTPEVRLGGP